MRVPTQHPLKLGTVLLAAALMTGCAAYRTESNTPATTSATSAGAATAPAVTATPASTPVLIAENNLPGRKYKEIGPIDVSVKKLTLFHKDPTKEQANEALIEKARTMGADAVINVTYKTGIGFTTWGYIDAKGVGVKLGD